MNACRYSKISGVGLVCLMLLSISCIKSWKTNESQTQLAQATETASKIRSIIPSRIIGYLQYLPKVEDETLQKIFSDQDTYWYDKYSLPHVYQDSVPPVLGVRYNSAGLAASTIAGGDRIFDSKGFHFPFATAAGTDFTNMNDPYHLYLINFLALPKVNGQLLNIPYWFERARRRWMFPIGTMFGELLLVRAPTGLKQTYYVVEVRTRTRYREGWAPNIYRPFTTAKELENALISKKPQWQNDSSLTKMINHLRNPNNMVARTMAPIGWYAPALEPLKGALDYLPDITDKKLIGELLTETVFKSAEGKIWKSNGKVETYAPSTKASFSFVPYNYEGGLLQVNEVSCNRCHQDAARSIQDFSDFTQLYGEIWGEDQIFTWHLFDDKQVSLNGPFDSNYRFHQEFTTIKLIEPYSPSKHTTEHYQQLRKRYRSKY